MSRAEIADPRNPRWVATPTVAYLWARTVRCKSCRASIPLLKTRWLCRKGGKRTRLVMVPTVGSDNVTFSIEHHVPVEGSSAFKSVKPRTNVWGKARCPRRGVWCPCCGRPGTVQMTIEDIQHEARKGNLGAVLTAVVCNGLGGKRYRLPTSVEREAAHGLRDQLTQLFEKLPFGFPTEPISPNRPSPNTRGVSGLTRYGISEWSKVFDRSPTAYVRHLEFHRQADRS